MAFGKVISYMFLYGIVIFSSGLLLQVFKGELTNRIKDMFWIDNTPFLNIMDIMWNVVPIIIMVLGVVCIVLAGFGIGSRQVVYQ